MDINKDRYFNKKIGWKKNYKLYLVDNKNKINSMINYFNKFKLTENKKASLDFEFNKGEIALFQICLENKSNKGIIFIFYPPELNKNQLQVLIELLTDNDIIKILHGGESLDIPYLFNNIFVTKDLQKLFLNNLIDTKYLCDYYHKENDIIDKKCKIYHILREMDVIDDRQLKWLEDNQEAMGPIYLVHIDIHNLSDEVLMYSACDTLYLTALVEQFPDNYIYRKVLPNIVQFLYYDKNNNEKIKQIEQTLNIFNNYYIKLNNENIKLIDIHQVIYFNVGDMKFTHFIDINYFRNFIEVLIKYKVYKLICCNYEVYKTKYDLIDNNDIDLILNENNKFNKINKINIKQFFLYFMKKINNEIKKLILD